jgi:hypothetical protein
MKRNIHVQLSAEIARRLASDPLRSNRAIADELGTTESTVRRQRSVLELAGLLATTTSRVGSNGVEQRFSVA